MANSLLKIFIVAATVFSLAQGLFVPEQLPTILSFFYTNIPPIRKGTDSRVGFGFRLGPNADVQVMLELGPQLNTAPIGPQKNGAKRETDLPFRPKGSKMPWLQAWKTHQIMQEDEGDEIGVIKVGESVPVSQDVVAHLKQLYRQVPQSEPSNEISNSTET